MTAPTSPTIALPRGLGVTISIMVVSAAGCGSLPRNPVPAHAAHAAVIAGMPGVRAWGGAHDEAFQQDLIQSVHDEVDSHYCTANSDCDHAAIALSGGGAHGAFGAGFLKGWHAAGGRPTFKLVTGISTGALMAPFVFLGPDYDDELEKLYTTIRSRDVYRKRNPFKLFRTESLAKTAPLAGLIERTVDDEMIRRVAEEHSRGRRLLVGTTNLDAERLVVWNMGAIASSDHPGAAQLFRSVLLASASIPVAFPPVLIEVLANGQVFDEMHVDGGVMAELFIYDHIIDLHNARLELRSEGQTPPRGSIYVIRNGKIGPEHAPVQRQVTSIAGRSLTTLLETVGLGDIFRVWTLARDAGFGFHYIGIPMDYELGGTADFDPDEMRALFELGYEMALRDERWHTTPPWLE
jgi:predicted acylesterase/phospholipase RssA